MQICWKVDPNERPTFTDICARIKQMLESAHAENYLDAIQTETKIEAEIHKAVNDSENEQDNVSNDYAEIDSKSNTSSDETNV